MRKLLLIVPLALLAVQVFAQTAYKGKVSEAKTREPIIGAVLFVQESGKSTVTDVNGNFTLQAQAGQTVRITYIGKETLNIKIVDEQSLASIQLQNADTQLNEVVVTGYQSQRKVDITGSVAVVNMKDVASIPTGNIISTLQGRVPGVNIASDGTPGGVGTSVGIRGITTINNGTPLYVIDGIQTRDNIATLLNPNDVESIQILKDAASASIYGTQAANGVIIITTKRAKKNDTRVDFSARVASQNFHTGIGMLNAQQWGDAYWAAYKNDGVKPSHDLYGNGDTPVIPEFINAAKTIRSGDTDWAKEVYNRATLQDYNVTVSKGSENGSSIFSLNYFDQDGLVKYTNFKRVNVRANTDYSFLSNRLRIGENINITNWQEKLKPAGIEELTIAQHPLIPVYDINGGYAGPTQGVGDKPNPVRLLDQQKQNRANQWRIFGNMYIEAEPIKNLIIRSNYSINYRNGFFSTFEPKWHEGDRTVDVNAVTAENNYDRQWIWTNQASYQVKTGKHSINGLVGTEAKENYNEFLNARRENYLIQDLDYRYISAGDGKQTNGGLASRTAIESYFGKVNYAFDDKYLISGTVRRDASSRFGKNNNAGVFPGVSGAWRISQERFLKQSSFINDLKLRASWGQNGNDLLDNEATYTKYSTNLTMGGYDIGGINRGIIPNGIIKDRSGNPNVKWEVSTQTNFGFDLSAMNNKLQVTLDYFIKDTKDMLIDRPYIAIIGEGGSIAYNGASLNNKGFEGLISWRDNVGKDFNYNITLTGSVYKNRVTDVPADIYYTFGGGNGSDKSIVGQPLGSWLGYRTNGLYTSADQLNDGINQPGKGLGRIRYVDVNGDKVINDKDREWLGSDQPKFFGGLNVSMTYKAFDFSFFVNGMIRDAYNNSKFYTDFFQLWTGNHGDRLLNAWTPSNSSSTIPALTAVNLNDEGRLSQYFIENGSYLKLKNIQLGYTLPAVVANRLKLRNLRVYLQGQDLITITGYKGADPEGLGYPYPLPRIFTAGLNFGF
jgi:TonB-linked SusC/RagA family outer membrane protein